MKDKNFIVLFICQAAVNIAIVAAALIAAIHFGRPVLMAWCLLAVLNGLSYETKRQVSE